MVKYKLVLFIDNETKNRALTLWSQYREVLQHKNIETIHQMKRKIFSLGLEQLIREVKEDDGNMAKD